MPTPTLRQARSQHAQQALIAAAAAERVGLLLGRRRPWAEVLETWASYQLAAATAAVRAITAWSDDTSPVVNPRAFAGVTSAGFPLAEPLIATIDARVPAPPAALPEAWWDNANAFMADAMRVIEGQVKDAARGAAGAEITSRPQWTRYVRLLTPPSCKRCVVLAGKVYRDLDGFDRHPPTCDCVHVPVESWDDAHDRGLVSSPAEAFEKGQIRDLTRAERKAVEDGADLTAVINSSSGVYTADMFGRRVSATRVGTTRRSAWRKQNPNRRIRLRPESIYRIVDQEYGGDREQALRLLRANGYLT